MTPVFHKEYRAATEISPRRTCEGRSANAFLKHILKVVEPKIQAYTFIVFFCRLAVEVFAADIKDRTTTSELIR